MDTIWPRNKQPKYYPYHHCFPLRIAIRKLFAPNFLAEIGSGIQVIKPIRANGVLGRYLNLVFHQVRIWQNDSEFLLQSEDAFLEDIKPLFIVFVRWIDAPVYL